MLTNINLGVKNRELQNIRTNNLDNINYMTLGMELWGRLRKMYGSFFITALFLFILPKSIFEGKITTENYSPAIYTVIAKVIDHSVERMVNADDVQIMISSPATVITACIQLAMLIALLINIPMIIYQTYQFVAPGLYPEERKLLQEGILIMVFLFLLGSSIAFFVVVPITLNILTYTSRPLVTSAGTPLVLFFSIEKILSIVIFTVFSTGLLYMLPGVIYLLVILDIVDVKYLQENRKNVILAILILAAVITPDPTAISMLIMSVPLVLIYEIILQRGLLMKTKYNVRLENRRGSHYS